MLTVFFRKIGSGLLPCGCIAPDQFNRTLSIKVIIRLVIEVHLEDCIGAKYFTRPNGFLVLFTSMKGSVSSSTNQERKCATCLRKDCQPYLDCHQYYRSKEPPPHGTCGSRVLQSSTRYSRHECMQECLANHTVNVCGCKFIQMPGPAEVCSFAKTSTCNVLLRDHNNITRLFDAARCNCPEDCERTDYDLRLSYIKPSETYVNILKQIWPFDISKQGVSLRIYYEDLEYTELEEEAVYTFEKLMCDIGGAAGLFLGCSFVTMVEFVDFVIEFIWFWSKGAAMLKDKHHTDVTALT
ncbi:unnamed protein product [Clavelina lepadiformis]|uniref:Uncharacterized protein n=1 Tax=Clavelina lepadiformis TaxID=159417 RepID=A0ABP0GZR0_CLALP